MEDFIDSIVVTAWPFLEGLVSQAQVVITAIPGFFEGLISQAQVVVYAIPAYGRTAGLFLILAVGGGYVLWKSGNLRGLGLGGGDGWQ